MREHVEAVGRHEECDVPKKCEKKFFFTKQHDMSIPNADGIMSTASWPTFSPQSAHFQYGISEFLSELVATSTGESDNVLWETASRCWRGVFFQRGTIVQQPGTDKYYVCLGSIGQLLVALWKVKPMMLKYGSTCFVVGSGDELYSNLLPTFINQIDLDDFEAVPS